MTEPILQLRGVNKSFGAVQVLHDVDFTVRAGEVTALVGDNGAGKSTLVKCVAGIHPIDSGEVLFDGEPVRDPRPDRRRRSSASRSSTRTSRWPTTSTSCRTCSSAGSAGSPWLLDEADMEQAARETLASLSVRTVTSVRMPVAALSGGQRQTVAIAKAVLWDSKVVLLDEPTAALGVAQTRQVLDLVRRLAEQGLGVVLISHNMADVFEVSDRIACLYLGRHGRRGADQGGHPRPGRGADHRGPLRRAGPAATRERDRLMAAPTDKPDTDRHLGRAAGQTPRPSALADFGIDTTAKTTGEAIRDYLTRLRNGDLGSLPALLGLAALFVLFTALDSGGTFPSLLNLANLLQQGAGRTIIAMGLVFVLLTGEIDLAAGTASGLCAAVMALHLVRDGNLLGGHGHHGVRAVRGGDGAGHRARGAAADLGGAPCSPRSRCCCWSSGSRRTRGWRCCSRCASASSIGCITGFLVAKIGMPSFVVTLALFIAWQGVILQLIGDGGTLGLRDPVINAVANGNLSTLGSWLLFVVAAGGYAAVLLNRQVSRRRLGLVAQPTGLVLLKIGAVVLLAAVATFLLTLNRSPGRDGRSPACPTWCRSCWCCWSAGTYVLDRTRFGRHIYAVGGNREAARRAGIDVARIRASVFVIGVGVRGHRRDRLLVEGRFGLAERRWRQHAAVRGRRRGDRRHVAVRRPGPGQQRGDRRRGAGHRGERAGPARAAGRRWCSWSPGWCCCSRPGSTCCPGADRP